MSTLSDILAASVASVEVPGRAIDCHAAAKYGVNQILKSVDLTRMAVTEYMLIQLKTFLGGRRRRAVLSARDYVLATRVGADGEEDITAMVPRQGDLFIDPFGLDAAHALEGGTGHMQRTENASMYEFQGFVRIRDKQIEADIRYANHLRVTLERLRPIWENDPVMTYREACEIYVRQHGMPPQPNFGSAD